MTITRIAGVTRPCGAGLPATSTRHMRVHGVRWQSGWWQGGCGTTRGLQQRGAFRDLCGMTVDGQVQGCSHAGSVRVNQATGTLAVARA